MQRYQTRDLVEDVHLGFVLMYLCSYRVERYRVVGSSRTSRSAKRGGTGNGCRAIVLR